MSMPILGPFLRFKDGRTVKGGNGDYEVKEFRGGGSFGETYRAITMGERKGPVAVKFFLPLVFLRSVPLFASASDGTLTGAISDNSEVFFEEVKRMASIDHPNVVRLLDVGETKLTKPERPADVQSLTKVAFLVMDFVPGPQDDPNGSPRIDEMLRRGKTTGADVVRWLIGLARALKYLHEDRQYLHGDLTPNNVLISGITGEAKLTDFSVCKNFNFGEVEPDAHTKFFGWGPVPPELLAGPAFKDVQGDPKPRKYLRDLFFPALDIYQFGSLLRSLRDGILPKLSTQDDRDYLDRLSERLTTWQEARTFTAQRILDELAKLDTSADAGREIDDLAPTSSAAKVIQLPDMMVTISSGADTIINTRSFRRLHRINQLCFVDLLYPCAGYKRFAHCLRAYALAGRFLQNLRGHGDFRAIYEHDVGKHLMLFALLHDINHFPLLHVFQESRRNILKDFDLLDCFCDGKMTDDTPSLYQVVDALGVTRERFRRVLTEDFASQSDARDKIIKSVIDSGADVDKLAYLRYDSLFTGVSYAMGIDENTLVREATLAEVSPGNFHLAFGESAIPALETLYLARAAMFKKVYWHHTNRALMAMLLYVIDRVYGTSPEGAASAARPADYIKETLFADDAEAANYLSREYERLYGEPAITKDLVANRAQIYKRLYSSRPFMPGAKEERLYDDLVDLNALQFEQFRARLRTGVYDFFRSTYGYDVAQKHDADVLLDLPGRKIDSGGEIWIRLASGECKQLHEVSPPVQAMDRKFNELTKKVRIFIRNTMAAKMPKRDRQRLRSTIQGIVEAALKDARASTQLK